MQRQGISMATAKTGMFMLNMAEEVLKSVNVILVRSNNNDV